MDKAIKQEVNSRLKRHKFIGVLLRFYKGRVFIVLNHHKYLNHQLRAAPKVLLGTAKPPKNRPLMFGEFMYITDPL
jgi:hypothetical protein